MSWLERVLKYLRTKQPVTGPISCTEMKNAEVCILRYVQSENFGKELQDLKHNGKVRKSSTLLKLTPVLDGNGLIVIGGRLSEASISQKSKFSVILPSGHKVSRMITYDYHDYAHLGTEWVLLKLRTRYWIIRARAMIKRIKHECVTCKRLYGGPVTQRMADLPTLRCQPDAGPFSSVGVDIFGPFYVTVGRSQVKRYGCIFSCFTSRAVHVEKIDDLSADAFIV